MSDQPKKSNFFEKLATFIVDKRNLIFFLYAIAIIASLITQSWVKVCDDLTQYLPETTETRQGLTLMEEEFTTFGTARVMVSHVTYEIAEELAEQMEQIEGMRIFGTSPHKSSVISFLVDGIHHYDMGMLLDKLGVAVRTGHHCAQPLMTSLGIEGTVRGSFAVYNTQAEADAFIAALKRVVQMFR